jgi:hypothetical protein
MRPTASQSRLRKYIRSLKKIEAEFSELHSEANADAASHTSYADCHALWRAVIARMLEDACALRLPDIVVSEAPIYRERARRWFYRNGLDFRSVCLMAALDPDAVRYAFLKRLNTCEVE